MEFDVNDKNIVLWSKELPLGSCPLDIVFGVEVLFNDNFGSKIGLVVEKLLKCNI